MRWITENLKNNETFCSKLYKTECRKYHENLNVNNIIDNRKFWKTIKPIISAKEAISSKINLVNNRETSSKDCDVAECFNDFFSTVLNSL